LRVSFQEEVGGGATHDAAAYKNYIEGCIVHGLPH
jgi:hypothetical protein